MAVNVALYEALRGPLESFTRFYNRLKVTGREHVPASGGVLLCPRHENMSDPFFVGVACSRVLHFLAWDGVQKMPLVGPLVEKLGVAHKVRATYGVALDRKQASRTMAALEELLRAGEACVIFPEGALNYWFGRAGIKRFRAGAVRLAAQAGVPILPVGLTGTRWVFPNLFNPKERGGPDFNILFPAVLPSRVHVRFGAPFIPDPAAATDAKAARHETERLRATIVELVTSMQDGQSPEVHP